MIGFLNGTIKQISPQNLILLISGVGYEIYLPSRTLEKLKEDQQFQAFIYTHVREDQLKLFGFETLREKRLFLLLIDVSGVGPKSAMAILSQYKPNEIETAISKADVAFFTQIKGLGKRGAQKIIIELKTKLGSVSELDLTDDEKSYNQDVILALQSFGFLKRDILPILKNIDQNLNESQQIKQGLKLLGKV